jgi:hypothetical protein
MGSPLSFVSFISDALCFFRVTNMDAKSNEGPMGTLWNSGSLWTLPTHRQCILRKRFPLSLMKYDEIASKQKDILSYTVGFEKKLDGMFLSCVLSRK